MMVFTNNINKINKTFIDASNQNENDKKLTLYDIRQ